MISFLWFLHCAAAWTCSGKDWNLFKLTWFQELCYWPVSSLVSTWRRDSQRLLCFIYFDILSFKCTVPTIQSLSTVAMATNLPANVKKRTGVRFNWATMRVCFPDYLVTFHRITFAAQAHSMCFMFTSSDKYTFSDRIFIDTCMQGAKIKCTTLLWLIAHPQNLTP